MTEAAVLGLPSWSSRRGTVVRGGTSSGEDSVLHGYARTGAGRRAIPAIVSAQSPSTPQGDRRLASATFPWSGRLVAIASWMHPLDEAFFAALGPIT